MSYNEGPLVSLEVVQYAESDSAQYFEFCSKLLYFTNTEMYRYEIVKCLPRHRLVAKSYKEITNTRTAFVNFVRWPWISPLPIPWVVQNSIVLYFQKSVILI